MTTTFDIITSSEQIEPEWMTTVLRSSGTIGDDVAVATTDVASMAAEGGLLSEIYRVGLAYEGGDGPSSAIVKIPIPDETQRFTADILGFYPRELAFYSEIAPSAPFDAPKIYGSAIESDSTDFVLVMEDLGHLRLVDQSDGVGLEDARRVLQAMAEFHATWWEHPELPGMSNRYLPVKNDVYLGALPGVFAGGWPGTLEHGADLLTPDVIAFGERFGELVPWLLSEMAEPATFVHGDWRSENTFFADDGSITMIDFQITGFASGVYDVAYFLGQSVDSDVRAGNEEELLRHYLAVLADNGVEYPFDEAWRKYRIVLAFCLIYGVTSFASWEAWSDRQKQLLRTILGRSVRSIVDTGALDVLP